MMKKFHITITLFACLLLAALTFGQETTGGIYGKITDEQGAVLPGVTVTLESQSIAARAFTSTNLGVYRFAQLAPGTYKLTFELSSFQTVVREGVNVTLGANTTLNVIMKVAGVEEVITVTGEAPVVDTKKTSIASDMSQEILANIPSARDPWVIMDQIAGVNIDRVNVGGSESGQQSNYTSHGSMRNQGMWNVDGVTITDMAATGSSPTYFDFDAFEEMQITTAGADPSISTPGLSMNFITKQGGNNYRGQFSFYGTSEALQADNRPEEIKDRYSGNKINSLRDYGFDVGGPVIKDRMWFWGAYRVQDIKMLTITGTSDDTWLENFNLKFHGQITDRDKLTFFYTRGNKIKKGRGAGIFRPAETTQDQSGPTPVYKIELQHIFNEKFLMTGAYAYVGGGFQLMPKGGIDAQPTYDYDTTMWGRSYYYYITKRPTDQVKVAGNYYLEEAMGGDHEFKFGFEYKKAATSSITQYASGVVPCYNAGVPYKVRLYGEANTIYYARYIGIYFGDTFTKGKLTLNLGARYDAQKSIMPAASGPANSLAPDVLPAIDFAGLDPGYRWNNFSPRLGFTYDLVGDGKTILRGNFSRYADQMGNFMATQVSPILLRRLDYTWNDANGDGYASLDELIGYPNNPVYWSNIDPNNPTSLSSPNRVDTNLTAPLTTELIIGAEREVMPQFSVGANFIYRRYTNNYWYPINDTTYDDWSAYQYTDTAYTGQTVNYYTLNFPKPAGDYQTNRDGYWREYKALEITLLKRLSNKWMMNGSFTYQSHIAHYDSTAAYGGVGASNNDPTNTDIYNGQEVAYQTAGSGKTNIYIGSKWFFKLTGMYQLPYGINVSGFLNTRQGYIIPYGINVPGSVRGQGLEDILVITDPFGTYRLPTFWQVDFRLEKTIDMGNVGSLGLMLDFFNITNNNMSLGVQNQLNARNADEIMEIVNPRVVRLGVRLRF
jgi:hypothetical protein